MLRNTITNVLFCLYFFLDLNMAIDEEAYKDVVANFIKFPVCLNFGTFNQDGASFWNLDHDQYL
ncbi:hypothetical protein CVS40_6472 [Lucilia cuprina]|nr:hypothetical protein CVS40_6472 [Lucilia cuprina]